MNSLNDGSRQALRALAGQMISAGQQLLAELAETNDATQRARDIDGYYSLDRAWELSWGTPVPRRPGEEID
jgi:hypothetical protein